MNLYITCHKNYKERLEILLTLMKNEFYDEFYYINLILIWFYWFYYIY